MSAEDSVPSEFLSIRATSGFQDDDEALENLVQMKEMEFGSTLSNTETSLNTEENESIHIKFSDDNNNNQLTLSVGDDSDIIITLQLVQDEMSTSDEIFDKLSENLDEINIVSVDLFMTYELPFTSLQLPIKEDTPHDVSGIKITHEGAGYVIQSSENEGETTVYVRWDDFSEDAGEVISDIGPKQIQEAEQFIESIQ